MADVVSLPRPTRTDGDSEVDLPPCDREWPGWCRRPGPPPPVLDVVRMAAHLPVPALRRCAVTAVRADGPRCVACNRLIAGFRGRLIHVDSEGGVVRGLDHAPELRRPAGAP